ncbi:LacI family DNA-binding transcriptional regulator [Pseudooctadecabacter jejudonensis]|uniref:HTH-type transcriptional regulator KdgR n=1 Tax=Pseudooctadecabacter jejudonensis TaxID=1391910 RepID=A0A1Y5RIK8_9RHOB|nr:LacI family DNA-binding transcriptional regulator [Pseudooctadecabacter jejudonensis]SLN18481.1 HTH-type transcriptional regulator KdgR [Pseudooctadecabacter jejudonensis]
MTTSKIKNMVDFAAVSGISRPTLSKYFNDAESVRPSTRSKIEAALEQHDYRPNIYAINQNRRRTRNIGLVVPNLTDPFFAAIARTIEGLILEAGYNPLLLSSHGGPEQEISNLDSLRSIKPAGVLLAPLGRASNADAVAAFAEEIPTVLFDANLEGVEAAFFGSDNTQSIGLIVDYLCRTGEPPVFFEMETPINPNALRRRHAYQTSMERLGFEPAFVRVPGEGWDFEEIGSREGAKMLASKTRQTNTILCSNDRLAIGLLSAAFEADIKVGLGADSPLRIAGHDDHPFAKYTCPSLTTISQDYTSIGARSVAAILAMADAPDDNLPPENALFEGRLVMRGSA